MNAVKQTYIKEYLFSFYLFSNYNLYIYCCSTDYFANVSKRISRFFWKTCPNISIQTVSKDNMTISYVLFIYNKCNIC